jgi:ribonucleoside-diphosphate reductase alpha chain
MSGARFPSEGKDEGRGVEARADDGWTGSVNVEAGSRFPAPSPLSRHFSEPDTDPWEAVEMEVRRSVITDPDGSVVFEMDEAEVPKSWSQLATDIVASKYFRKAGVGGSGREYHEDSVKQLISRVVHTIRRAGEDLGGYFADAEEADAFEAELTTLLVSQRGAFNSPVWFNCGLFHEYDIHGSGGNFAWDPESDQVVVVDDAYSRPQCSACFIQSVDDDLMSIFTLIRNEARLFKYGSGTGTNFSSLRSCHEILSGGGTSSGLMSFLEVLDRAAGATKSGGTTRRAAKMVCLDLDHPEILDFIDWKKREEEKARALIDSGYPADFNGEAYRTVSGQNSNNSVRVTDEFMEAIARDGVWQTRFRTTDEIAGTYRAREVMDRIAQAAWECADPGVQYDSTINRWNTCKVSGRINASNPCSEFMFLDDSACNLASLNLLKFLDEDGNFDVKGFRQAIRIFVTAMEILVDFSSYPTKKIARNSHDFRPLGLGYANLGTLLMCLGIPYDSPRARSLTGAITAILTGHAYRVSAELAGRKGAFPRYEENADAMAEVIRLHQETVGAIGRDCPADLLAAAREDWQAAVTFGDAYGYRNAQMTVLAPTGTIGLLMDCDTTGIEPDFALVKFKKLAGGGYFKIVNRSVPAALRRLGYTEDQIADIDQYVRGTMTLEGGPGINRDTLREKGLSEEDIEAIEAALPGAFDLEGAITPAALGEATMERLGFSRERWSVAGFSLLREFGFTRTAIEHASDVICGRLTVEGAPHLLEGHLPIFDCASRCGRHGKRFISPQGHLGIMAAAQKFISGAISKTVNVPEETTQREVEELFISGWKMGLKAVALYRDGCKRSQPLSSLAKGEAGSEGQAKVEGEASRTAARRVRLPKKRQGFTQEARVGGHKVYLRTGEYGDGRLGEIFIDMHKEGAAFRSMMNCFAIAVSLGLQYGVPLEEFIDVFTFTRFEPQGHTDHPNVRFATSVIDFVFRLLAMEYLGRDDMVQVPPTAKHDKVEGGGTAPTQKAAAGPRGSTEARLAPAARVHAATDVDSGGSSGGGSGSGNGRGGNGKGNTPSASPPTPAGLRLPSTAMQGFTEQLTLVMKDAPFCDACGHLTVRNGACYKCLNCGQSMGCS